MIITGILAVVRLFLAGTFSFAIYKTFTEHSDYWIWQYILVPLFFIFFGIYYFTLGTKKNEINFWISTSLVFHLLALLVAIISILMPVFYISSWASLLTIILIVPTCILMVIGIAFLIIGSGKIKSNL